MKPPRHPLATLRRTLGLRQKDMAELLECSLPTIQAIEYGHLKLSDKLAQLASQKTGVDGCWLRTGLGSIIDQHGKPYTRETYDEYHRAMFAPSKHPVRLEFELKLARSFFLMAMERMAILFAKALQEKNLVMCQFKVASATEQLLSELGTDKSLSREELDCWKYSGWIPEQPQDLSHDPWSYLDWIEPKVADAVGADQMLDVLNRFLQATDAIHQEHLKTASPRRSSNIQRSPLVSEFEETANRPLPYSPPVDQNLDD
jgi:DNA-binding XRE family transcriptional regulator